LDSEAETNAKKKNNSLALLAARIGKKRFMQSDKKKLEWARK